MFEKKIAEQELIRWPGNIPVEYLYTTGVAGERFFGEIKEKGRIMGTHCTKCRLVYLPPRMFCERCFRKLERWKTIPKKGVVKAHTTVYVDLDGNPSKIPVTIAFIGFKGIHGGLIHKLDEIGEEIKRDTLVVPVFEEKKKRTGSILDIKYFKPI